MHGNHQKLHIFFLFNWRIKIYKQEIEKEEIILFIDWTACKLIIENIDQKWKYFLWHGTVTRTYSCTYISFSFCFDCLLIVGWREVSESSHVIPQRSLLDKWIFKHICIWNALELFSSEYSLIFLAFISLLIFNISIIFPVIDF